MRLPSWCGMARASLHGCNHATRNEGSGGRDGTGRAELERYGADGGLQPMFATVAERADVLLLCGDLCDYGTVEEAHILVRELSSVRVPIVAVLGNHDFESGQQDAVKEILCEGGIQMLDGDAVEIKGVGFAGVK